MTRRVSPLTRERARDRMLALPEEVRLERLAKMRRAREAKRANRPERLAEVESRIDELGAAYSEASTFKDRQAVRRELRDLGDERVRLRWG